MSLTATCLPFRPTSSSKTARACVTRSMNRAVTENSQLVPHPSLLIFASSD
jgi:hypothetical protein